MNFVPVLSKGSTRSRVLYWGAPGWSIANVSSRCASKLGGSAATTKTSSPPERGLSCAAAGAAGPRVMRTATQVRIHSKRPACRLMVGRPYRFFFAGAV